LITALYLRPQRAFGLLASTTLLCTALLTESPRLHDSLSKAAKGTRWHQRVIEDGEIRTFGTGGERQPS
jgi:hypothetical protein